jgi:tetratricopeptide (TPR) repeat protein
MHEGDLDDAEAEFREAIRLDSRLLDARYDLGRLLAALGQPDEAEVQFRDAVRLEPDRAEDHYQLAHLLAHQGTEEAEAQFRTAIRLSADPPEGCEIGIHKLSESPGRSNATENWRKGLEARGVRWGIPIFVQQFSRMAALRLL